MAKRIKDTDVFGGLASPQPLHQPDTECVDTIHIHNTHTQSGYTTQLHNTDTQPVNTTQLHNTDTQSVDTIQIQDTDTQEDAQWVVSPAKQELRTKRVQVVFTPSLLKAVDKEAKRCGVSRNELIHQVLSRYLEGRQ